MCCYRQEAMPGPDRPFKATMCYLGLHTPFTHSFQAVFCRKLADVWAGRLEGVITFLQSWEPRSCPPAGRQKLAGHTEMTYCNRMV